MIEKELYWRCKRKAEERTMSLRKSKERRPPPQIIAGNGKFQRKPPVTKTTA